MNKISLAILLSFLILVTPTIIRAEDSLLWDFEVEDKDYFNKFITALKILFPSGSWTMGDLHILNNLTVNNLTTLNHTVINSTDIIINGTSIDDIYVNEAGDTMTGWLNITYPANLNLNGGSKIVFNNNTNDFIGPYSGGIIIRPTGPLVLTSSGSSIAFSVDSGQETNYFVNSNKKLAIAENEIMLYVNLTMYGRNISQATLINTSILEVGSITIDDDIDDSHIEGDVNTYVDIGGDTMTGDLDMGANQILKIGDSETNFTSTGGLILANSIFVAQTDDVYSRFGPRPQNVAPTNTNDMLTSIKSIDDSEVGVRRGMMVTCEVTGSGASSTSKCVGLNSFAHIETNADITQTNTYGGASGGRYVVRQFGNGTISFASGISTIPIIQTTNGRIEKWAGFNSEAATIESGDYYGDYNDFIARGVIMSSGDVDTRIGLMINASTQNFPGTFKTEHGIEIEDLSVADVEHGIVLRGDNDIVFRDYDINISSQSDGNLTISADDTLHLDAQNVKATNNITVSQNNAFCLTEACDKYIYYNGSAVIIQG